MTPDRLSPVADDRPDDAVWPSTSWPAGSVVGTSCYLDVSVHDARSQAAIARLGASCEGTLRRYQRRADGTVRDTVLFSITVEDWPDVRESTQRRLDDLTD